MSPIIYPQKLARLHLDAMETGDIELARAVIHPDHVNHEAPDHPPASAIPGVPGFLATSAWLRLAFSELRFDILEVVAEGDRTIAHVTMSGRQTGPFVVFPPNAKPVSFPPTGKPFTVRQCHVFTTHDGMHHSHAAVRDDLGMMTQLSHLPPSPAALARMARWNITGRHSRAVQAATTTAAEAARRDPLYHQI